MNNMQQKKDTVNHTLQFIQSTANINEKVPSKMSFQTIQHNFYSYDLYMTNLINIITFPISEESYKITLHYIH